jgi:hypothetical protein
MSELLGLCSGTFSDGPKKKSENQHDMGELLGLCSGNFSDASNTKPAKESQDNMNELLGLCSGRFTDEKKTNSESESQNMSELLGLCSGKFGNENTVSKSNGLLGLCSGKFNNETKSNSTSESQDMNELLGLCSGKFDGTQKADSRSRTQSSSDLFDSKTNVSLQSESSKKDQLLMNELLRESSGRFNSVGSTKNSVNEKSGESESGIFSQLGVKRKPKSKQGLSAMFENMGDDESSMDDVVALCSGRLSLDKYLHNHNHHHYHHQHQHYYHQHHHYHQHRQHYQHHHYHHHYLHHHYSTIIITIPSSLPPSSSLPSPQASYRDDHALLF